MRGLHAHIWNIFIEIRSVFISKFNSWHILIITSCCKILSHIALKLRTNVFSCVEIELYQDCRFFLTLFKDLLSREKVQQFHDPCQISEILCRSNVEALISIFARLLHDFKKYGPAPVFNSMGKLWWIFLRIKKPTYVHRYFWVAQWKIVI